MNYHHWTASYFNSLSQHESQRILQVTLEGSQPPGTNSTIYRSVIRAQRDLHYLSSLEALLGLRGRNQGWDSGTDGKDA